MDAILDPFLAHQFENLEELAEMKILLIRHDIQGFVEIVFLLAIAGGGDIAGCIYRAAVGFDNDARRHIPRGEINDFRALIELGNTLFTQFLDNGRHFILIEGLAGPTVKINAHACIRAFDFANGAILHFGPQGKRFGISGFDFMEPGARLIIQRRIFFGFFMEADIEGNELANRVRFNILIPPELVCRNHLAKLRSPVAEVIDADCAIPEELKNAI